MGRPSEINILGIHSIQNISDPLGKIKELADQHPYHKYNGMWSRHMENASFLVVFLAWLGLPGGTRTPLYPEGTLLTYEQVATEMGGYIHLNLVLSNSSANR